MYLVTSSLYLEERIAGFYKPRSKHCEICLNGNVTSTSTRTLVIGARYIFNHKFNFNENYYFYFLNCNECRTKVRRTIN